MHERRLLLATTRPAVRAYFSTLAASSGFPWAVHHLRLDGETSSVDRTAAATSVAAATDAVARAIEAVAAATDAVARASVAVVDAVSNPPHAVAIFQELRRRRPELPLVGLLCCSRAVTAANLQAFLAAGTHCVLDLESSADEVYRTLRAAECGEIGLHLTVRGDVGSFLSDANRSEDNSGHGRVLLSAHEIRLLEMLGHGLTDREIGGRVHLSPNTVHHEVQRLYRKLQKRNRTELAAWAGHQGYYRPLHLV